MDINSSVLFNSTTTTTVSYDATTEKACELMDMKCFMILTNGQSIAIAALCLTVGPFTVLANILVLYIVFFTPQLRCRPSYLFITSLAFADLCASINFVYSFVSFHVFRQRDEDYVFLFKLGGVIASFSASVGSLLLTAIDRYICIHKPSEYRTILTRRKAVTCLLFTWSVAVFIAFLPLMGWNCIKSKDHCCELFPLVDKSYLACWIILITFLLVFIIYAYIHILWKAHAHSVYMEKQKEGRKGQVKIGHRRMDIKLAKTLGLILVILIVCWSPVLTLMIYDLFAKVDKDTKKVFAFFCMLCWLNSTVNPVIYALRSRDMRNVLLSILPRYKRQLPSLEGSTESDGHFKNNNTITTISSSAGQCNVVNSENCL
ncbi:cannabinoid receptor 2 [Scyliorhinus canicula]|uniref:cannabinoid receptor 2 n=1 Tax=Scyliorhinus canicula TaxID=7830 RepID=UPI0018F5F96A|nr:cannabinoid receptor 2 [Scyliorhinus canicula]XP_038656700.1 cannabinoid receptor 2 [Scyliorhinus canicula]